MAIEAADNLQNKRYILYILDVNWYFKVLFWGDFLGYFFIGHEQSSNHSKYRTTSVRAPQIFFIEKRISLIVRMRTNRGSTVFDKRQVWGSVPS